MAENYMECCSFRRMIHRILRHRLMEVSAAVPQVLPSQETQLQSRLKTSVKFLSFLALDESQTTLWSHVRVVVVVKEPPPPHCIVHRQTPPSCAAKIRTMRCKYEPRGLNADRRPCSFKYRLCAGEIFVL